jgi:hypothetical protein
MQIYLLKNESREWGETGMVRFTDDLMRKSLKRDNPPTKSSGGVGEMGSSPEL